MYIYFARPRALLHTLRAYRAAYPHARLHMACDAGCHNFTAAADHFGASHDGRAHALTAHFDGGAYMNLDAAPHYLEAVRAAVTGMTEPWFILLEDDVWVRKRIASPLLFDINGWAPDKSIVGVAEAFVRARNPAAPEIIPLAGFGGSVYRTAAVRDALAAPTLEADLRELYDGGKVRHYGPDYLLGSLIAARNGTLGTFCGYVEDAEVRARYMKMLDTVEVLHSYKELYSRTDLPPEDKEILGPLWENHLEL